MSNVHCLSSLIDSNDSFKKIIENEKLKENVQFLYIDNCKIDAFPEAIAFPELTDVDMSENILKDNFENSLPDSVRSLKVRNCGLTEFPQMEGLKILDIGKNDITDLKNKNYLSSAYQIIH